MFFFQDDIGLLIQLHTIPFWHFLTTPQAEHFAPVLHILSALEYKLFRINFLPYVTISLFIHLVNCILLGFIVKKITKSRFFAFLAVCFFLVNLTYTEPILWFSAQGVVLSTFFLELSFLLWYEGISYGKIKNFLYCILSTVLAGFSFGVGVGVGLIFAFVTYIYHGKLQKCQKMKVIGLFILVAISSYLAGPFIAGKSLGRVVPTIGNPFTDIPFYLVFVAAGVARGVVGRFFLPGFEPHHYQVLATTVSFLPVIFMIGIPWILSRRMAQRKKFLFIVLSVFIAYPYVWAGFLRYQFGLKQALAERYAYPSLFFFSLYLTLIIEELFREGILTSKKFMAILALLLLVLQSIVFVRNAQAFEVRPQKTQKYFSSLNQVVQKSTVVIDLPLPLYINQEYSISQLAPVLRSPSLPKFSKPDAFCSEEFQKGLIVLDVKEFYEEQVRDPVVSRVFSRQALRKCEKRLPSGV